MLHCLSEREQKALHIALLVLVAAGVVLSWLWPSSAGICLLFPLMAVCFFMGSRATALLLPMAAYNWLIWSEPIPNLMFICAGLAGVAFCTVTTRKYREARQHELRLDQDLVLAREVQQSMYPKTVLQQGPLQLATHMEACHSLGGDFLCTSQPGPGRFGVLLGDVMGKGTQAALTAALVDGIYSELAEAGTSPGPLMSQLNDRLLARFGPAVRMATIICLELNLDSNSWVYSRAGHPPPLLSRADGSKLMLDAQGLMAGVSSEQYQEAELPLCPGDQILMVSDGLVLCDLADCQTLAKLMSATHHKALEESLQILVEELHKYLPGAVDDDETAALLRFTIED